MTTETEARAASVVAARGGDALAFSQALDALRAAGIQLVDTERGDFAVRWIDVNVRAVPPDADTIIRTVTTTINGVSTSKTHWLEGIKAPPG
jgi:hypothetical protein